MDNTPIKLENILEQAPNWTFAGDFTLLQWMNKISQDLETRANKTSESLSKLNNNVRSINIGLDNVANSLTTLQFGNQFVECRVQDDDETLANGNEATGEGSGEIEQIPSSQEMLKTFLDNNLKILRNCHEKYSLDLDDSDDDEEEGPKEKTCIYQPINPYNEKPLPFIFGSKDWHAKWHVGLYDQQQDNNYSGDEVSETFSDSDSQSPTDDQESFESNTEWPSSNSIDNDNYNASIEVRNASSLRGSQPLLPATPSKPIKVNRTQTAISESSSLSTPTSSSLTKVPIQTKIPKEMKTPSSASVSSISSKASSKNASTSQANTKAQSLAYKTSAPPYVDLFAEPPEDIESNTSSSISSNQNTKRPSLDFTPQNKGITVERPSMFKTQSSPYVDLFAEPPEDIPSTSTSSVSSTQNIKRKPVNLFDDDEEDDEIQSISQTKNLEKEKPKTSNESLVKDKRDLLPVKSQAETYENPKTLMKSLDKPLNVSITPKSLFDDDDDENDDFLKAFIKKSSTKETSKTALNKTLLFDDLNNEPSLNHIKTQKVPHENKDKKPEETKIKSSESKNLKTKTINIFDDFEDDEEDNSLFQSSKQRANNTTNSKVIETKSNSEDNKVGTKSNSRDDKVLVEQNKNLAIKPSLNLFDDLKEDVTKESPKDLAENEKAKKKINLFDDFEDENNEEDDLFSRKPKENVSKALEKPQIKPLSIVKDKQNSEKSFDKERIERKSTEIVKENEETSKSLNKESVIDRNLTEQIQKPLSILQDEQNAEKSLVKENIPTKSKEIAKENVEKTKSLKKESVIERKLTKQIEKTKTNSNNPPKEMSLEPKEQILSKNITNLNENINDREFAEQNTIIRENSSKNIADSLIQESLSPEIQISSTKEVKIQDKSDLLTQIDEDKNTKSINETIPQDSFKQLNVKDPKPLKESIKQRNSEHPTSPLNIKSKSLNETIPQDSIEQVSVVDPKPFKESLKQRNSEDPPSPSKIESNSFNQELNNNNVSPNTQTNVETLTAKTLPENSPSLNDPADLKTKQLDNEIPITSKESDLSSSAAKYDFNSVLFLDEPPEDDSDFFETLSKSPLTLNTKYNSIDLENDLYEPDLPKVPGNNVNINQTDLPDNRPTSLYTGLQLFSDIPPDDDEEDEKLGNVPTMATTQTKRLHSVFYDDFNETLMALNKNQEEINSIQSLNRNESSPLASDLNKNQEEINSSQSPNRNEPSPLCSLKETQHSPNFIANKDVVDHKMSEVKAEIDRNLPEVKSKDKSENILRTTVQKSSESDQKSSESSKKRPVSKLQMPNININVQALLPGANTTLRKAKDEIKSLNIKESKPYNENEKPAEINLADPVRVPYKESPAVLRTSETEHILTNVTKTRVRAPATRRPSTRKARQDNYRKSLLEEEQNNSETLNVKQNNENEELKEDKSLINKEESQERPSLEDLFKKVKTQIKPSTPKSVFSKKTEKETTTKDQTKHSSTKDIKNRGSSIIFDDEPEDDDLSLFKVNKTKTEVEKSRSIEKDSVKETSPKKSIQTTKNSGKVQTDPKSSLAFEKDKVKENDSIQNITKSSEQKVVKKSSTSLLFDDEEEDNSLEFFKDLKSSTSKDSNKLEPTKELQNKNFFNPNEAKDSTKSKSSSTISKEVKENDSFKPLEDLKDKPVPINSQTTSSSMSKTQQTEKSVVKQESKLLKTSVSFLDEDSDNDDSLFGPQPTKSVAKPTQLPTQTKTQTFLDNKRDNQMDKSNQKDNHQHKLNQTEQNPLYTTKQTELSKSEKNKKAKAEFKSFLDNESDDEDFTVAGLHLNKSKSTQPSQKITTHKPNSSKNTSTIFTDSDTDSEDLFGKITSNKSLNKPLNKTQVSNKQQQLGTTISKSKPNSSIFSDDSGGDDDFLKPSESASKNRASKSSTQEKKAKSVPQSNASLFSDIDSDEDDLFGSGASKSTTASTIPTTQTSATSQTVASAIQTSKPKTIADNPLADLL